MFGLGPGCPSGPESWPTGLTPADQVTPVWSRTCTGRTGSPFPTVSMSLILKKVMNAARQDRKTRPWKSVVDSRLSGGKRLTLLGVLLRTPSPTLRRKRQPLKQPPARERIKPSAASFKRSALFILRHFWPCWGRLKFPLEEEGQASSPQGLDIMQYSHLHTPKHTTYLARGCSEENAMFPQTRGNLVILTLWHLLSGTFFFSRRCTLSVSVFARSFVTTLSSCLWRLVVQKGPTQGDNKGKWCGTDKNAAQSYTSICSPANYFKWLNYLRINEMDVTGTSKAAAGALLSVIIILWAQIVMCTVYCRSTLGAFQSIVWLCALNCIQWICKDPKG